MVRMERRARNGTAPAREGFLFFLWAMGYHLAWLPVRWLVLPWWASLLLPVCWLLAFLLWCFMSRRAERLFLTVPRRLSRGCWLSLWPLALFPGWNLLWGDIGYWEASRMAPALLAAIVEEFFFRGVFLSLWGRGHGTGGVFASAVVFAAYHALSPDSSGIQLLCALAAGVCYGEATLRTESLLPAVLAHLAVNLTGARGMGEVNGGLWACAAVCLTWGLWGARKRKKEILCNST